MLTQILMGIIIVFQINILIVLAIIARSYLYGKKKQKHINKAIPPLYVPRQ